MDMFTPGSHGSTFGGNPLATAVGKAALDVLADENLAERSAEMGAYLMSKLKNLNSPLITEIRGKGLWIGIDIDPSKAVAHDLCLQLLHEGIIAKDTHDITIRLAPPLIITKDEIDWAMERIAKVFFRID